MLVNKNTTVHFSSGPFKSSNRYNFWF